MSAIEVVGVLGAGTMGSGIAQVAATAGLRTVVYEPSTAPFAKARAGIEQSLGRLVEKGKLAASARTGALERIAFTTDLALLAPCDLVVEAVTEDRRVKGELYRALEPVLRPSTLLASNTSSLSITELAAESSRADRFLGLHFFNPVPVMALVEVVPGLATGAGVVARACDFVRAIGKEPVEARDGGGFLVNRLLVPYLLDAVRALEQGAGSISAIDAAMRLGAGHPMGPFALLDTIGLDTVVHVAGVMYDEMREARYAPPPLLRRMVATGWLGRKAGRGFYDWRHDPPQPADLR